MEKTTFDNKLWKDLRTGVTDLSEVFEASMSEATNVLTKNMTPKQKINHKLFMDKLIKLKIAGKHKDAEELRKNYSEQF